MAERRNHKKHMVESGRDSSVKRSKRLFARSDLFATNESLPLWNCQSGVVRFD